MLCKFNVSGRIKIKKDKTKLVCIGKKKHCGDKLKKSSFKWDNGQFYLLGFMFSVDLFNMINLHFNEKKS